jgi:hypothetical protein
MNGGRTHDFQESLNQEIVDGILARCRNLQDLQDESGQTDDTGQTGTGEDGLAGTASGDGGRSGRDNTTSAGGRVATGRRSLGGSGDGGVGEGRGSTAVAGGDSTSRSSSTAMWLLVGGLGLLWIRFSLLSRTYQV